MGAGWLEAAGAEPRTGVLVPVRQVKFGLAGKDLWQRLDRLRVGPRAIPASSRWGLRRSPGEVSFARRRGNTAARRLPIDRAVSGLLPGAKGRGLLRPILCA